jgi:leucine dehydrogenase
MSAVVTQPATGTAPGAAVPSSHPSTAAVAPVALEHEDLVLHRGSRSGRYVIVAVHSTALGPALGGVRLWHYAATTDGIRDALRLARGMTFKAAAAGLALGGGKGVICSPPHRPSGRERRDLLLDFGDLVESLEGRYITAEDVGISPSDLVVIRDRTSHVTGLPPERGGSGDPSPFTALGVEAAMRACAREQFGSPELADLRIAIAGLGHVGEKLARRLVERGARVAVSDIAPEKKAIADELGAEWLEPTEELVAECDILAPCALGGAIDPANLPALRCQVVCGCANNQLVRDSLAESLADRGILYAPDFVVNAGGLIHVYREIQGYSESHARELALGIEANLQRILSTARERGVTPLAAARAVAAERLEAAGAGQAAAA